MSWPSDGGRVIAEAKRQRVNPYTLSFSLAAKRSLDRAPASLCNPQTTSDKRASGSRGLCLLWQVLKQKQKQHWLADS